MAERPKIENAPGLTWRKRRTGWEARWRARIGLVREGYTPKIVRLWIGTEPNDIERQWIMDRCAALQSDMLVWSRGGIPLATSYDGTVAALSRAYQTDADSNFRKLRFRSREGYVRMLQRIEKDRGTELIADIKARSLLRWHEQWSAGGKVAMAHSLIGMLRTIIGFGAIFLEDPECERLSSVMHGMRFKMATPRSERITADQVIAIRQAAHAAGLHSIALAQALQFEIILRQKDVIGEWVPMSEPGTSEITRSGEKWLRGLRWSEIDSNMILRHVTSKRQKEIEFDLKLAPMVLEELTVTPRQASGPIIVSEIRGVPWTAYEFRRQWRAIAKKAGVPDNVFNMDSRAGAISEATDAGAPLEHVRHAATHSDISMTQRYSRGSAEKTAGVAAARAEHRNKAGK